MECRYNDTRIRPWDGQATQPRRDGAKFKQQLRAAIVSAPDIVTITSFNEWYQPTFERYSNQILELCRGEGTQIEPAQVSALSSDLILTRHVRYLLMRRLSEAGWLVIA